MLSWHGAARYALDLVGGDAHADAGAADQDAALGPALAHGQADLKSEVGVVHAVPAVRADVEHFVAHLLQDGDDAALDLEPAMVAADGDFHGTTRGALARPSR